MLYLVRPHTLGKLIGSVLNRPWEPFRTPANPREPSFEPRSIGENPLYQQLSLWTVFCETCESLGNDRHYHSLGALFLVPGPRKWPSDPGSWLLKSLTLLAAFIPFLTAFIPLLSLPLLSFPGFFSLVSFLN